jgi:hypothetical protein
MFRPVPGARYVLHGDLAIKGDRAGVALSHVKRWEERHSVVVADDGEHLTKVDVVPHVHNDFTFTFEADLSATPVREIQIRWLRQLAYELIKRGFYIGQVSCDGFQSVDTLQQFSMHGLTVQRVSTDRDPGIWKTLKDIASENRLSMPWNPLLQIELEGLNQVGEKIDHMVGASKDAANAFACSIAGAIHIGGTEEAGEEFVVGGEAFDTG